MKTRPAVDKGQTCAVSYTCTLPGNHTIRKSTVMPTLHQVTIVVYVTLFKPSPFTSLSFSLVGVLDHFEKKWMLLLV